MDNNKMSLLQENYKEAIEVIDNEIGEYFPGLDYLITSFTNWMENYKEYLYDDGSDLHNYKHFELLEGEELAEMYIDFFNDGSFK